MSKGCNWTLAMKEKKNSLDVYWLDRREETKKKNNWEFNIPANVFNFKLAIYNRYEIVYDVNDCLAWTALKTLSNIILKR